MTQDLTKGTPWKIIVLYSIPILLGNLFQLFYNMTDTVIVGNILGLDALGAVGSTTSTIFLICGFANGLAGGFAVPVAQEFGAHNEDRMRHYVGLYVVWMSIITAVVTVFAVLFCKPLLRALNTPENIFGDTYDYLVVIFGGMIFTMLYNGCANVLRAVGDSRTPLYFLIISSLLNIGLDIVLIKYFHMGTMGASVATVAAQMISGVLCLIYIKKRFPSLHLKREDFIMDWELTRRMFAIGVPMALQFSITAVGAIILQASVNSFGSVVLGAQTAAGKVENIGNLAFFAVGAAMATYTAQNVGARAYERIIRGTKAAFLLVMGGTAFSMFIFLVPRDLLLNLFVKDLSEEALNYAHIFLNLQAIFMPFLGLIMVYRNILQGAGISFFPMLGGLMECVARILVCILANRLPLEALTRYRLVCLSAPIAWFATGVMLFIRYQFFKKQLKGEIAKA